MRIRRLRNKYRTIAKDLYRENKQFKVAIVIMQQSHEKKLMDFDAKEHYMKVYSRYNNAFFINLLKKKNRYYTFIIKINVTRIVININKYYSNVKNFKSFKKDRYK